MPFTEKRLAGPTQLTTSSASLYTVPSSKTTIVKQIVATNTSASAANFSIYIGSAASASNAIFRSTNVVANESLVINLSQVLATGEVLNALASANTAINLTISGVENDGPLTPNATYIADGSVTTAKIADGAIYNVDVNAAAAIDKTKIAGTAITAADTGTVTSTMILDGTIATGDIANNAITQAKLDTAVPLSGFRNRVINGAMVINQRGASSQTGNTNYLVDRWRIYSGNVICGLYTSTDAPAGFRNSIYAQCNTASGNSSYNGIVHQIEGYNIADFGFGTASPAVFTVSFWVKSSKNGVANFSLSNSNNTRVYVTEYTINSANTWEYKTLQFTADTTNTGWDSTNGMGLRLWWDLGSDPTTYNTTANTWFGGDKIRTTGQTLNITSTLNATLYLTGVQVEKSTQVTPFEQRPIGVELALCQRYYTRFSNWGAYTQLFNGTATSTSNARMQVTFPVLMRTPTSSLSVDTSAVSTFRIVDGVAATNPTAISLSLAATGMQTCGVDFTCGAVLAQYRPYYIDASNQTAGSCYVGFSAEF